MPILSIAAAGFFFAGAALSQPTYVIVSTEVDETINGSGYMQRHALSLDGPDYNWNTSGAIFFDPATVINDPNFPNGIDTGLDAFHFNQILDQTRFLGQYFFSTEVDFWNNDTHYEDEDLLVFDEFTGSLSQVFDTKDILGDDYGLDAATYLGALPGTASTSLNNSGYWAFSTEEAGIGFSGTDILITDGASLLSVIPMAFIFGQDVGLDALHYLGEGYTNSWADSSWAFSTEVDGSFIDASGAEIFFTDQDVLIVNFVGNQVGSMELAWSGEEGFGRDVGLDALYLSPTNVPEPGTLSLIGACLGLLVLRVRKKRLVHTKYPLPAVQRGGPFFCPPAGNRRPHSPCR